MIRTLRRLLPRGTKLGHAGTLDPEAFGVLPIALGEATKLISYAQEGRKVYKFRVYWGEQRTTDDAEGEILLRSEKRPQIEEIEAELPHFLGKIEQVPPRYSAKKIQGKRACDLMRQGQDLEALEPCAVEIDAFKLEEATSDFADFKVTCSKGTYVRSLARDLGERLGCYGYATSIHRVKVGSFQEDSCICLEKLANLEKNGILTTMIKPPQAVLDDIPAVLVELEEVQKVLHGQAIVVDVALDLSEGETVQVINASGNLVALARVGEGQQLFPKRVFPQLCV